mmetsp:Transcript_25595/g.58995  ORF Transcript_25595/g.58995 Transcript_25595/m.58995 type:complete len:153 (-) Transcript_25595:18-476(-)
MSLKASLLEEPRHSQVPNLFDLTIENIGGYGFEILPHNIKDVRAILLWQLDSEGVRSMKLTTPPACLAQLQSQGGGSIVGFVNKGGSAQAAGLHAWDVITQCNGKDVTTTSTDHLKSLINGSNESLVLTVMRLESVARALDKADINVELQTF